MGFAEYKHAGSAPLSYVFMQLQKFTPGGGPVQPQPSAVGHWGDISTGAVQSKRILFKNTSLVVIER